MNAALFLVSSEFSLCVCVLQRTRESWQIVFFITAGMYAVGAISFLVLASGTIQPWAIDSTKSCAVGLVATAAVQGLDCVVAESTDRMLTDKT